MKEPEKLEFKAGDLVRLKSGGPVMTVSANVGLGAAEATGMQIGVYCEWFVDDEHRWARFYENSLEHVREA